MTPINFSRRLREAIESRRPLEELLSPGEEVSSAEEREWRRQVELDRAIGLWLAKEVLPESKVRSCSTEPLRYAVGFRGRFTGLVAAAVVVLLIGVPEVPRGERLVHGVAPRVVAPAMSSPVTETRALVAMAQTDELLAGREMVGGGDLALDGEGIDLVARDTDSQADRELDWRRQADRLVYAVEPVGEGVSAVWQRLVEAVPGVDVIAAWHYET